MKEEKQYKILWIDDEHEKFTAIKPRVKKKYGIHLHPFKSLNMGIGELERNYASYDGVLLDARFLEHEDDADGSEDSKHIHRAKERILQLPKKFEIFVWTGQADLVKNDTFQYSFENVYEKGLASERDRLFTDIVKAANQQEDTQIRHQFNRVFEVCTDKYIGKRAGEDLLTLLKVGDNAIDTDKYLTAIRKITEDIFFAFYKQELLPYEFIYNQRNKKEVKLNASSIFLEGKNKDLYKIKYKHLKGSHLHRHIANQIRSILHTTQPGSHRSTLDHYINEVKNPYLFKSTLYQVMDVIAWVKIHFDSNPPKRNWEVI